MILDNIPLPYLGMKYTSACLGLAIPPLSQRTSPSVETPLSEAAIAFSMSIAYEQLNHKLNHPTQAASPCFTMLHHASPCFTMLHHASPCFTMLHHASPANLLLGMS